MKLFGQIDLTKGKVTRNLILFTLPFFITYFLNSFYSAIDLMFIGQASDTMNQAAVSAGTTIMFAVNSVITGLATGGTIVIGQYFGAKNENINKVTKNLIVYMGIVCIAILVIMLALFAPIMTWMQLDEGTIHTARIYLLILVLGIPLYVGYTTISAILRGLGNSFAPFIFFGLAVVANIGLDALFVIGLNKGAIGAAIATVLGEAVGLIASIIYLIIVKLPFKVKIDFKLERGLIKEIVKCGLPIAIQDGLVVLSFAVILAAISTRGDVYTATVGITDRVTSFGFVPLSAIGSAMSTATAQCMGANDVARVRKYVKCALIISLIMGSIYGTLCQIIPSQLASIFTDSNDVIELASPYIQSTALDIYVCMFVFPINAVFIGSGHTVFAMGQNLGVTFAIRIPVALVFTLVLSQTMYVIGLSYAISTVFSLIMCLIYYFSKKWVKLNSETLIDKEVQENV